MHAKRLKLLARLIVPQLFFWALTFKWIARTDPFIQLASHTLVSVIVVIWLVSLIRDPQPITIHRLVLPLGLFILYEWISIVRAPLPWHSVQVVLASTTYLALFIFLQNKVISGSQQRIWENTIIAIGAFFSLFNLFLVANELRSWQILNASTGLSLPFKYRLPGGFLIHPNYEAAFINLLIPLLVGRLFLKKNLSSRLGIALLLSLFSLSLYFSSSRGGWIAGTIGVIVTIMVSGLAIAMRRTLSLKDITRMISPRLKKVLMTFGIIGALAMISGLYTLVSSTGRPPLWPSREKPWTMGWELFSSAPLWGHGAGSVHVLITQDPSSPPIYLTHTHNILLQAGAELGLVGLFLLGWSLIQIGRTLVLAFRGQGFEERIHLAAISGSLAATAVHHLVDYTLEVPMITVALLFIIASLCRYSPPNMNYQFKNAGAKKLFALVILIIVAAFYYPTGQFRITDGIREFNSAQSTQSILEICDEANSHNRISYYQFACGRALAEEGYRSGDRQKLMEAIEHINKGLEIDPYWPMHWANLAALEWEIGNEQDALIHMETAYTSAPDFPVFNINYGWMLEQSGDFDRASRYYSRAVSGDPLIVDASILKRTEFQPDSVSAEQILPTNFEANDHALRGWYYAKLQEWDHAREEFDRAVTINPAHAFARSGLAFLDLLAGSISSAEVHSKVAENSPGNNPMIHFVAGKIALEQGDLDEAMGLFERAYDLYSSQTYSDRYYKVVYRLDYIIPETVPQLKSVFVTEDMITAFHELADYKLDNQQIEEGQEILRGLQMWIDFGSIEPIQP